MVLPICPLPMNPTVVMFLVSFQKIRTMSCGGLVVIRVPATGLPSGTWTVDSVHSVASFAVRPIMVGTFRGEFSEIDAALTDGKLIGNVEVASLQIKDENLKAHLFSPDFFDVERFPEIVHESTSLTINDGLLSSGAP